MHIKPKALSSMVEPSERMVGVKHEEDCGNEYVMVIKHEDASMGEPLLPKHAYNDDVSKTNFQGASMARTCLNLANAMSGYFPLSLS